MGGWTEQGRREPLRRPCHSSGDMAKWASGRAWTLGMGREQGTDLGSTTEVETLRGSPCNGAACRLSTAWPGWHLAWPQPSQAFQMELAVGGGGGGQLTLPSFGHVHLGSGKSGLELRWEATNTQELDLLSPSSALHPLPRMFLPASHLALTPPYQVSAQIPLHRVAHADHLGVQTACALSTHKSSSPALFLSTSHSARHAASSQILIK